MKKIVIAMALGCLSGGAYGAGWSDLAVNAAGLQALAGGQNSAPAPDSCRGKLAGGVDEFVNAMATPSASFISPVQTHRVAGQFKLRGQAGRIINVSFIGSTHEWVRRGDTYAASEAELKFIYKYFFNASDYANRTLLIEQGTSAAENRLAGFIQHNGQENPGLLAFLDYRIKSEDRATELPATCLRALGSGAKVSNMDLLYGQDFLKFYLDLYGAEAAVRAASHALYSLQFSAEQALWTIEKMIAVNGLERRFDMVAVRRTVNTYYPRLLADDYLASEQRNEVAPDQLRNRYMAGKVYQQNSDVYVLAHTSHIVGIINALKDNISGFEVFSTELSAPAEEKLAKLSAVLRKELSGEFRQRIYESIAPLTVKP